MIILKWELYDYYITSQDIGGLPRTPSLIRKLVQQVWMGKTKLKYGFERGANLKFYVQKQPFTSVLQNRNKFATEFFFK